MMAKKINNFMATELITRLTNIYRNCGAKSFVTDEKRSDWVVIAKTFEEREQFSSGKCIKLMKIFSEFEINLSFVALIAL